MNSSTLEFGAFAESLVDASGKTIMAFWRKKLDIFDKVDESPVTVADRTAELLIRQMIEREYPDHGIAGEEFGQVRMDAEYIWSIDPVDGTKAFISGSPLFGTLIALLQNGAPILGIVDIPAMKERWIGGRGIQTTLNKKLVQTRTGIKLQDATSGSTSPSNFVGRDAELLSRVHERLKLPIYGHDCYLYGLLALGTIDLVIEAGVSDYDYLAPSAIVDAAGGIMTGWEGEPLGLGTTDRVVAAGDEKLHAEVIELLNGD